MFPYNLLKLQSIVLPHGWLLGEYRSLKHPLSSFFFVGMPVRHQRMIIIIMITIIMRSDSSALLRYFLISNAQTIITLFNLFKMSRNRGN